MLQSVSRFKRLKGVNECIEYVLQYVLIFLIIILRQNVQENAHNGTKEAKQ